MVKKIKVKLNVLIVVNRFLVKRVDAADAKKSIIVHQNAKRKIGTCIKFIVSQCQKRLKIKMVTN